MYKVHEKYTDYKLNAILRQHDHITLVVSWEKINSGNK